MTDLIDALPYGYGPPQASARLRVQPEDFVVEEIPLVQPSGAGEHVFLRLRKRNLNTADVAQQIARLAGVRLQAVGYAGLKDRMALATQTFSVHLPGQAEPDWQALESEQLQVLETKRHQRKLRRGALRGNRFQLRLRDFSGDRAILGQRLEQIAAQGVPNYFGAQRFGNGGRNLQHAQALLQGQIRRVKPHLRSLWLSAARSWLFNQILAKRVRQDNWNRMLEGDVLILNGAHGQFHADLQDASIIERFAAGQVHASGLLPGRQGRCLHTRGSAGEIEQAVLSQHAQWLDGLARAGLQADRRALRMLPLDLKAHFNGADLLLAFRLEKGCYATMLVRELLIIA